MNTMKAVVLTAPTKAENIILTDYPVPRSCPGWVLIRIKAFGMNHSEQILRLSEIRADYIQKPIIPGIECVGEIEDPSDSDLKKGQKVIAFMGGMGRNFHGSYAEYALLPVHHVFPVDEAVFAELNLSWTELAAVPETYFTAWGSLFECLNLHKEDTLLIRGGTCALGYAAIQIAKASGCRVIATTHREGKLPLLREADEAMLDTGNLAEAFNGRLNGKGGITKVLELVGVKTLADSLMCVEKGGIVCNTGVLGGVFALNGFDPIKCIPNGVYLTGFHSNYPTRNMMDAIFTFLKEHHLKPLYGAVYDFSDITKACIAMDSGKVNGKIVVEISDT